MSRTMKLNIALPCTAPQVPGNCAASMGLKTSLKDCIFHMLRV